MKHLLRKILSLLKRKKMNWYYLELDSVDDVIDMLNGVIIGNHAKEIINDTDVCIDNNMPDTFPDLVFSCIGEPGTCEVNGNPVTPLPLTGGYHPLHRPTPRPR